MRRQQVAPYWCKRARVECSGDSAVQRTERRPPQCEQEERSSHGWSTSGIDEFGTINTQKSGAIRS